MELDLETLELKDLRDLKARVERAIATFDDRRKKSVVGELEEVARKHGFSLAELAETVSARKRAPVAAKYANPANSSQTWSGRGRKPRWLTEAVAAGRSIEDFAI